MSHPDLIERQTPATASQRQAFEALCAWILAHLDEPLGWQELMAHSGLDFKTINLLFFKFGCTTPMTWIRQQRLACAPRNPAPRIAALLAPRPAPGKP